MRLRANVSLDAPQLIDPRLLSAGAAMGRLGKALALGMIEIPNRIGQAAIDSYEGKFNPLDPGGQAAVGQEMFRGALDAGLGMGKYSANALAINRADVFRNLVTDAPDTFKKLSKKSQEMLLTAIKTVPKVALDSVDNISWGKMPEDLSSALGAHNAKAKAITINKDYEAVAAAWKDDPGTILGTLYHELTHGLQNSPRQQPDLIESIVQKAASAWTDYGVRSNEQQANAIENLFNALYRRGTLKDEIDSDAFMTVFSKYQKRANEAIPEAIRITHEDSPLPLNQWKETIKRDALRIANEADVLKQQGSLDAFIDNAGVHGLLIRALRNRK